MFKFIPSSLLKNLKISLFFFLSITLSHQVFAYDFQSAGICYNIISDNQVEVTYFEDHEFPSSYYGDIVIPEYVEFENNKYQVTAIGENAFMFAYAPYTISLPSSIDTIKSYAFYSGALEEIDFPESLETIGDYAFYNCVFLKSLKFPTYLKSIGESCFSNCYELTEIDLNDLLVEIGANAFSWTALNYINIPQNVEIIGEGAFGDNKELTAIEVEEANNAYTSVDGILYTSDLDILIQCPGSKVEAELPGSVRYVCARAFYGCKFLNTLICHADVPPTCGEDCFKDVPFESCKVWVPFDSFNLYNETEPWNLFVNIETLVESSVDKLNEDGTLFMVYDLQGRFLLSTYYLNALRNLSSGIYIVNGRKIRI